jgi:hypothetical protein
LSLFFTDVMSLQIVFVLCGLILPLVLRHGLPGVRGI